MSDSILYWQGRALAFKDGQSIAAVLAQHGLSTFGQDELGTDLRLFCGSGLCQCCLVRVAGRVVEACITPARDQMTLEPLVPQPLGGRDGAV